MDQKPAIRRAIKKTILGNSTPGDSPSNYLENSPSSEVGPTDSGGDQSLLTNFHLNNNPPDEAEIQKRCEFLAEENHKLLNRIKSLEDRLAIYEKNVSYNTDEAEFMSPQKKSKNSPKSPYSWMINSRKNKKRKATNSPEIVNSPPNTNPPSQQSQQTKFKNHKKEAAPPSIYINMG